MIVRTAHQIKTHISDLQRECDGHSNEYYKAKKRGDHHATQWHYQSYIDKQNRIAELIGQLGPRRVDENAEDDVFDYGGSWGTPQYHISKYKEAKNKNWEDSMLAHKKELAKLGHTIVSATKHFNTKIKPELDRLNKLDEAYDNTSPESHKDFVTNYHDLAQKAKKNNVKFAHKQFISIRDEHIGYYNEKSKNKLSVEGDNLVHRNSKGKKIELYPRPTWQRLAGV